jgi:hypothetical protein
MIDCFHDIDPKMWWIVNVGFSHALGEENPTKEQEKCLHFDSLATSILYEKVNDNVCSHIMDLKIVHDIWTQLDCLYGESKIVDDVKLHEKDDCIVDDIGDVELIDGIDIIDGCSIPSSSDCDDCSTTSSLEIMLIVHALWLMVILQAHLHHLIVTCLMTT